MPQTAVACPACKFYLGDESGFHPMGVAALARRGWQISGGLILLQLAELAERLFKEFFIEAGADAAGIDEFFFFVVIAQQERSEPASFSLWICVSDDDHFLALAAFAFQPAW